MKTRLHNTQITRTLLTLTLFVVTTATSAFAQQRDPDLDHLGLPVQGRKHTRQEIPIGTAPTKTDKYLMDLSEIGAFGVFSFPTGANGNLYGYDLLNAQNCVSGKRLLVNNATFVINGFWKRNGGAINPTGYNGSYTHSNTIGISHEEAQEISASLAASVEAKASPFGVGTSITLEASVSYARSLSNTKSQSTTSQNGIEFPTGRGVEGWQRVATLTVIVDCRTAFRNNAEFQAAMVKACGQPPEGLPYNYELFKQQGVKKFTTTLPTNDFCITTYPLDNQPHLFNPATQVQNNQISFNNNSSTNNNLRPVNINTTNRVSTAEVNGRNATRIVRGKNGRQMGLFRQLNATTWIEESTIDSGRRTWTLSRRGPWSVFLQDGNQTLMLDMFQKKVYYSTDGLQTRSELWDILQATAN